MGVRVTAMVNAASDGLAGDSKSHYVVCNINICIHSRGSKEERIRNSLLAVPNITINKYIQDVQK